VLALVSSDLASAVQRRSEVLYGGALEGATGVLHVCAVWRERPDRYRILRIGPRTPRSETDTFALGMARARAEAVVTTGQILRDERETTHRLPPAYEQELAAWRREVLHRDRDALSVVLSSGRDLPLEHPLFTHGGRAVVVTTEQAAARIGDAAFARGVEVVGRSAPGPRDVLEFLRGRGLETIAIEAGASTAAQLYEDPVAIDELLLSVYCGAALPEALRGAAFPDPERVRQLFREPNAPHSTEEPSGRWTFHRYLRR